MGVPTPRQTINTANDAIEKELFEVEPGDIKQDNQSLEKRLKKIKDKSLDGEENSEVIAMITRLISDNYNRNGKVSNKKVKEEDKNTIMDSMADIFHPEDMNNDINRFSRYSDYRIVDHYVSEISDAIDVLKDSIVSPDDISKKSALFQYNGSLSDESNDEFEKNMKILFEKFNFQKFVAEKIRSTLTLGDGFTIVGSMANEFSKMLNENKDDSHENIGDDGHILNEDSLSYDENKIYDEYIEESFKSRIDSKILLNENIVNGDEFQKAQNKYIQNTKNEVLKAINKNVKYIKDPYKALTDRNRYDNSAYNIVNNNTRKKLDINGAHFKDVKPEDMIKLEVDHVCIGYLYINRVNTTHRTGLNSNINPSSSMLSALTAVTNHDAGSMASHSSAKYNNSNKFNIDKAFTNNGNTALEYEALVDMLITGISKKIDNKFIEKNESARDLILALVKTDYIIDKEIEITFLEPEMVHHVKLDSSETYGNSVLSSSLFYIKLYLASLITNMMVKINQGRDRRVYYVDSDMDVDIEGNIEQLIRDLKSSEIPSDLFSEGSSISTVLKSVGALDNYYIPTINGKFCPLYR